MNLLVRSVVVAFVGTLLAASCGGDSNSGDDGVALCKQGCNKVQSLCFPDGGPLTVNCDTQCAPGDGGGSSGSCSNQAEINSATKTCLDKNTCQELLTCVQGIPRCQGGGAGGTGGSGGTGATGGSGGAGGGGTGGAGGSSGGGTCADLLACCNRATEQLKPGCMTLYNNAMTQGDATCGGVLMQFKATFCP